ncbi:MAG: O-antigen ligase family protein [Thermodesulfobacteriota bacterium]
MKLLVRAALFFLFLFVGVVYGYSVTIGFALSIGVGMAALFYIRPSVGILFALFVIPLDALGKITPDGGLTLAKVVILLVLITYFFKAIVTKDSRLIGVVTQNPIIVLCILYLVFSFTSVVNATAKDLWFGQLLRRINLFLMMILIINMIQDKEIFKKAVYVLFIGGLLITAAAGIFELTTGVPVLSLVGMDAVPWVLETGEVRISGTSSNPDFHAAFMILPTGLALTLAYLSKTKLQRTFYVLAILIFLVNIFGTGSRGGLIGFLFTLGVFFLLSKIRWKWAIGFGAVFAMILTAATLSVVLPKTPFGRYTGETGTKTLEYRVGWLKMGIDMIADNPILGHGTGHFLEDYSRYRVAGVPRKPELPENSFMQSWIENGIFSFLIYLSLYLLSAKNFCYVFRSSEDIYMRSIGISFLAILAGLGFFAMTSNVLETEAYWIIFAFSVVILNVHKKSLKAQEGIINAL